MCRPKLKLPRSRVEINQMLRLAYDSSTEFHNMVEGILSLTQLTGMKLNIAREILVFGDALVCNKGVLNPDKYQILRTPKLTGLRFKYLGEEELDLDGEFNYYAAYSSPYDTRGTSFFHPQTLKLFNDKTVNEVAIQLRDILEKPYDIQQA